MGRTVEKVTAFVTRRAGAGPELLLFEHPHAGIQIPAGTVEDLETPQEAVLREVQEETGLVDLNIEVYLGCEEQKLPAGEHIIAERTRVYARPDFASFDWAYLRRGIQVSAGRRTSGFSQITYEEFDRQPEPRYTAMSITGWVPDNVLAQATRRHFYWLTSSATTEERWAVATDNHTFALFWAPLRALPEIISPQDRWLKFLLQASKPPD